MKGIGGGEGRARSLIVSIYGQSRATISIFQSTQFWSLESGLDVPFVGAINKDSGLSRCCCYNWFLAADFRPDSPSLNGGRVDKKFSSCFLNSYIIQTHFRMKPPTPPVVVRRPDRSNMFPILSVPLTRNWEWILFPSPPLSPHLRLPS